jgi:HTH-type transcriptional repressor of puuD
MKLVHNGNPNRTLAMMFETYQPGTTTGERIKHQGEEIGTILEGEVILTINGQTYPLVAGQSYAINTWHTTQLQQHLGGDLPHHQCPHSHHVLISSGLSFSGLLK